MIHRKPEAGFTLLEAMIALAIVAMVVTSVLAVRTNSLIDASEARNWRVAREVAQEILSELSAGARDEPPEYNMQPAPIPSMKSVKKWSYQIVIGQERIASIEADIDSEMSDNDNEMVDRRNYQRERDDLRQARQKGMSFFDYREQAQIEEDERLESEEDIPPSEDEFEEVAVFVFFPNVRPGQSEFGHFVLKSRISTLAIEGLTTEQAESLISATEDSTSSEGEGTPPGGGTSK
ncbi:MAG: prepilin-type N-terminal cleavage/methylation domain-containing protein [Planctomycetota bacterium]|nr:prepilin-type N-terminal cleavage/methylation domain-containing protein [Planctomycetota bacterium]